MNSQHDALQNLRSRTANRRNRRQSSRQGRQSQPSNGGADTINAGDQEQLHGVEDLSNVPSKYATPPSTGRRNESAGSSNSRISSRRSSFGSGTNLMFPKHDQSIIISSSSSSSSIIPSSNVISSKNRSNSKAGGGGTGNNKGKMGVPFDLVEELSENLTASDRDTEAPDVQYQSRSMNINQEVLAASMTAHATEVAEKKDLPPGPPPAKNRRRESKRTRSIKDPTESTRKHQPDTNKRASAKDAHGGAERRSSESKVSEKKAQSGGDVDDRAKQDVIARGSFQRSSSQSQSKKLTTAKKDTDEANDDDIDAVATEGGADVSNINNAALSFASPESQKSASNVYRSLLVCGKTDNDRLGLHLQVPKHQQHVHIPHPIRHFTHWIKMVAAGRDHTLALSMEGHVYAWGLGHDGRLGLGTEENALQPTKISFGPLADQVVTLIACGEMHSMAVTESMKLFTWGRNYYGRLGHGDSNNRYIPEMIRSISHLNISNVSAGVAYSCAVSVEGALYTWGYGGHGQLGHNDQRNYSQPHHVKILHDEIVTRVEAAYGHTLCLTASGELFAWGSGHGLLGLSDPKPRLVPTKVSLLSNVEIIDICCGYDHSLALNSVGEVYSWGNGGYGQLGQSEGNLCISTPEIVGGLSGQQCVRVFAGEYSSVAITAVGSIFSWGGGFGALGHEDVKNCYEPKMIEALKDSHVVSCSVGSVHSLILVEKEGTHDTESEEAGYTEMLQDVEDLSVSVEEAQSMGDASSTDLYADVGNHLSNQRLAARNGVEGLDVIIDSPIRQGNSRGSRPLLHVAPPAEDEISLHQLHNGNNPDVDSTMGKVGNSNNGGYSNETSSLGRVDRDEWLDEGEGAISLRVSATGSSYIQQSPELYSRETLSKYGDTMAKFGYQGFSGEENYRKKYSEDARTPTTYMRSTPSTGRTIGSTTFYNNPTTSGLRVGLLEKKSKSELEIYRWLEKNELQDIFEVSAESSSIIPAGMILERLLTHSAFTLTRFFYFFLCFPPPPFFFLHSPSAAADSRACNL